MIKKYFVLHIAVLLVMLLVVNGAIVNAESSRPKVGLVLSGGGAKGFAHIGVLEALEAYNIPIDYITGTSMGALIGALYSMGYSTEQLREVATETDWAELVTDSNRRERISLEEKFDADRFIFSVPVKDHKIEMPSGLIEGQNIYRLLSQLTVPARHVRNFEELPIPFACIATDIVEGKASVLKSGSLPDALRATMSIPPALVSWEIDGRVYVDGGITRNLPVEEAISMGADIIIGVDVGAPLYSKDELGSMINILQQAIIFRAVEDTKRQRTMCHILVLPDIEGFSSVDFFKSEGLIENGRNATLTHDSELKKLAAVTREHKNEKKDLNPINLSEKIHVTKIRIRGLDNVSENIILNKLNIATPKSLTFNEIDKGISRIFGTLFFKRISYQLDPGEKGEILTIRVKERKSDQFRFGFRYDSVDKSELLLNSTFRNRFVKGSRQSFNLKLAEKPSFWVELYESSNVLPGLTHGFTIKGETFDANYMNGISLFDNSNLEKAGYLDTSLLFLRSISSSRGYGLGIQGHFARIKEKHPDTGASQIMNYGDTIALAYYIYDSLNRSVRPTSGSRFNLNTRYFLASNNNLDNPENRSIFDVTIIGEYALKLRNISLLFDYRAAAMNLKDVTPDYAYSIGGRYKALGRSFPMAGIEQYALSGSKAFVVSAGLHFDYSHNVYVQFKTYAGNADSNYRGLFKTDNIARSSGIIAGIYSPIGPIELSVFNATGAKSEMVFFSIGHFF